MPLVTAYDDVPSPRVERHLPDGHLNWRTDFIQCPKDKAVDTPMAFLSEGSLGRVLRTHFHRVDQFHVICMGKGSLGRYPLAFGGVHFARAYTPYGPINHEDGLGFIALRAHRDDGAQYMHMPENRAELESVRSRVPWQCKSVPDFSIQPGENGIAMKAIDGIQDEHGLAAYSVVMKPGATAYSIDLSKSDGQYILVMKGGLIHEGVQKNHLTVIWVEKNEGPFRLIAGPEGAELIILNFPVPGSYTRKKSGVAPSRGTEEAFKVYQCRLCAFVYDESAGHPDAGIAPGTRWVDVPETFQCPDCEARKSDFEMIEI